MEGDLHEEEDDALVEAEESDVTAIVLDCRSNTRFQKLFDHRDGLKRWSKGGKARGKGETNEIERRNNSLK